LVEKITVYDGGRLIVSLLGGTDIECKSNGNELVGVILITLSGLFVFRAVQMAGIK